MLMPTILYYTVYIFPLGQEQIPKILMDVKEDYYGVPADFQFLKVKTNEPDGVTYKWMKDGQQITEATRPPFTDYDSDTLWPSSKGSKEYAGVYQFVMTTKAGSIAGRKITVDFTCKCFLLAKLGCQQSCSEENIGASSCLCYSYCNYVFHILYQNALNRLNAL